MIPTFTVTIAGQHKAANRSFGKDVDKDGIPSGTPIEDVKFLKSKRYTLSRYETPIERERLVSRLLAQYEVQDRNKNYLNPVNKCSKKETFVTEVLSPVKHISFDELPKLAEKEDVTSCAVTPKTKKTSKNLPNAFPDVFTRLSNPRKDTHISLVETEEEFARSCTFKPDISKSDKSMKQCEYRASWQEKLENAYRSNLKVEERLQLHEREKRLAREATIRKAEKLQSNKSSQKPKINRLSSKLLQMKSYTPIHERASAILKAKEEKMERMKLADDLSNLEHQFQPKVLPRSEFMARQRIFRARNPELLDVTFRLARNAHYSGENLRSLKESILKSEEEECNFQPKLSKGTQTIIAKSSTFKGECKDFLKRQQILQELSKQNRIRRSMQEEYTTSKFKPNLKASNRRLHKKNGETASERFTRLSSIDKIRKEESRNAIREGYYAQYNFQPRINPRSRRLSKSRPKGLYASSIRNNYKSLNPDIPKEDPECTFAPQTNSLVEDRRNFLYNDTDALIEKLEEQRRNKEKKLHALRREMERHELESCTFKPFVNRHVPEMKNKPVIIKGLGKHLEQKEKRRQLQEEQRAREQKAFFLKTSELGATYTVPKPFNLSYQRKSNR